MKCLLFTDTEPLLADEDLKSKATDDDRASLTAPSPPRRSSQTSQKLKRWSKMIKYTLPSKGTKGEAKPKTERKSLRERLTDGELAVFLRERRAVSESRFRVWDKLAEHVELMRAKSDPKINADEGWNSGITTGSLSSLKQRFESPDLKSPDLLKKLESPKHYGRKSPSKDMTDTMKKTKHSGCNKSDLDQSTTSPESGMEEKKSTEDSKRDKKDKAKKEKKKEKKKHSTCTACNSDQEQREKKREKKRQKREKEKQAKKDKGSCDQLQRQDQNIEFANGNPVIPPYPKMMDSDWTVQQRDKFFQKLLLKENGTDGILKHTERRSRPTKRYVPVKKSTAPSLNIYLNEKKVVSDSVFKRYSDMYDGKGSSHLPPGVTLGEHFFDTRSKFENGALPIATFPRSISNLEKRSCYSDYHQRAKSPSSERRPTSALSQTSEGARSCSFPRPSSAYSDKSLIDHEEYKNYVLEMMHSTQKSARFQQLQNYYNQLDRALKLEKKSASMEIHKLSSDEVVDFETWRKMRNKEKAKEEMNALLSNLKAAQKAREFYFRPKDAESYRWRGDAHLRGRDKSVENLKSHFNKLVEMNGKTEENKNNINLLNERKDVYKPLWRAKSVSNVAEDIQGQQPLANRQGKLEEQFKTFPKTRLSRPPPRSKSSLTNNQVNALKDQLNEIYGSISSLGSSAKLQSPGTKNVVHMNGVKPSTSLIEARKSLEEKELFAKDRKQIIQERLKEKARIVKAMRASPVEEQKKQLSFRIGQEIKEKSQGRGTSPVQKKFLSGQSFDLSDKIMPLKFRDEKTVRDPSPRTCYSLENDMNEDNVVQEVDHDEKNDFLLVLNQDVSKANEVKNVVDNWASGDEGNGSGSKKISGKQGQAAKSSDSLSSSGASTATVIQRSPYLKRQLKIPKKDVEENTLEIIDEKRKSVEELRKSFENMKEVQFDVKKDQVEIFNSPKVSKLRKSFEDLKSPQPATPKRDSSFTASKNYQRTSSAERSASPTRKKSDDCKSSFYVPSITRSNLELTDDKQYQIIKAKRRQDQSPPKHPRTFQTEIQGERRISPIRSRSPSPGKLIPFNMPELNLDYIEQHLTDSTKPVIKTQEIGDIQNAMKRLENKSSQLQEMAGNTLTQSKAKLKHICKKVGHSKILGKMVSLHNSSQTDIDQGTIKLLEKAMEEDEYHKVFQSGEVDSKVEKFEHHCKSIDSARAQKFAELEPTYAELDEKYPFEPAPTFSWSKRFSTDLAYPASHYTRAVKHGQFKNYYGYLPADVAKNMSASHTLPRSFKTKAQSNWYDTDTRLAQRTCSPVSARIQLYESQPQPRSLPANLNHHQVSFSPPPLPERKYIRPISSPERGMSPPCGSKYVHSCGTNTNGEPTYSVILPKSLREKEAVVSKGNITCKTQ